MGWIRLDWVRSGWIGLDQIGLGQVQAVDDDMYARFRLQTALVGLDWVVLDRIR